MVRKTNKNLVAQLREHRDRCGVFSLTFIDVTDKRAAEAELQKRFKNWWDSWIDPILDTVEERLVGKSKVQREAKPATEGLEFEISGRVETVKAKCGNNRGHWYCITHSTVLMSNFEKDTHAGQGCRLAWGCHVCDQYEVP